MPAGYTDKCKCISVYSFSYDHLRLVCAGGQRKDQS